MKKQKLFGLSVKSVIVALLLAGCVAPAAPAPAANKPAAAPAATKGDGLCGMDNGQTATGDPIVVGGIVGATGPDDWTSGARAATAYFNCVNANGGINGRPIKYIVEDDAWNPEKAGLVASKLVKDDKVVAMVGNTSFVECGVNSKLYGDNGLAVIAAVGVPRECFESPNIAATNSGPRVSTIGVAQYAAKKYGYKKMLCVATNVPSAGNWTCDGVIAWGKTAGVEVGAVYVDNPGADFNGIIAKALSDKNDAIIWSVPLGFAVPAFKAGEEQKAGDKVRFLAPTSIYDVSFPKQVGSYWNGKVDSQIELNATDSTGPDNKKWLAIMDKYGDKFDSKKDPRDTFSQAGYLAAKIFVDTALKLDAKALTRESLTKAIRGVRGYKSDLMCGAWYYAPGDRQNANHAGRMASLQDGKWVTVADCFETDDVELKPILDMEAKEGLTK